MKVSVVIPAYNEENYLPACLESLQKQTVAPDEVIVVDNNSTDQTAAIARRFGARVISESEQGMIPARNAGFNAAQYDIIARCDSDTVVMPDWIEKIHANFEVPGVDAITGPCYFYDVPMKKMLQMGHVLAYFKGSKAMLGHETLFGSNMALTKAIWEKVRSEACLDSDLVHEDMDLAIHINDAGGHIHYDTTMLASIASRRAKSPIPELVEYLAKWPKTRILHSKRLQKRASRKAK